MTTTSALWSSTFNYQKEINCNRQTGAFEILEFCNSQQECKLATLMSKKHFVSWNKASCLVGGGGNEEEGH